MPQGKLISALKDLCGRDIRFVVVGDLALALNDAPAQTIETALVYSREPENVHRLLDFLRDVDAIFRIQPARRLRPNESRLAGGGHLNLLTRHTRYLRGPGACGIDDYIGGELSVFCLDDSLPRINMRHLRA